MVRAVKLYLPYTLGALTPLGLPLDYVVVDLDALSDTDMRSGYPSPTLLYQNRDLFGMQEPTPPFPAPI